MNEQRTSRRQRVLKTGTIAFNGSGIDCVVRNISATGAALEVESQVGIPSEFNLVIAAEKFSEFCHVLWRKAQRLGVVFQPEGRSDSAPPLAPAGNNVTDPPTDSGPACIRSEDTLPEHPGPPLAPDLPC